MPVYLQFLAVVLNDVPSDDSGVGADALLGFVVVAGKQNRVSLIPWILAQVPRPLPLGTIMPK